MAKLIYSAIASLDGYVADKNGNFDWAAPDEEVHAFVNNLERPIGSYLYGRRMYETMAVWDSWDTSDEPAAVRDFAQIWRAADKIVYSRTLQGASSAKTRIEHDFDATAVKQLKAGTTNDLGIGGSTLAAEALKAGLVDEIQLFLTPIIVGSGTSALPHDILMPLELLDEHRFTGGVVYLRYRVLNTAS